MAPMWEVTIGACTSPPGFFRTGKKTPEEHSWFVPFPDTNGVIIYLLYFGIHLLYFHAISYLKKHAEHLVRHSSVLKRNKFHQNFPTCLYIQFVIILAFSAVHPHIFFFASSYGLQKRYQCREQGALHRQVPRIFGTPLPSSGELYSRFPWGAPSTTVVIFSIWTKWMQS